MTTTRPTISTEAWNNMTAYEQEFLLNWEGYKTMTATRPETISQEWWDAMTEDEREFVVEHERGHAEFQKLLWDQMIKEQDQ